MANKIKGDMPLSKLMMIQFNWYTGVFPGCVELTPPSEQEAIKSLALDEMANILHMTFRNLEVLFLYEGTWVPIPVTWTINNQLLWCHTMLQVLKILWDNLVNIMDADALVTSVTTTSPTMILNRQDKQILVFHKEGFLLPVPYHCWEMINNSNTFIFLLKLMQPQKC